MRRVSKFFILRESSGLFCSLLLLRWNGWLLNFVYFGSISNYHHFLNFSFLLHSVVSHNDSLLFITLIKVRLYIWRKWRMLGFYISVLLLAIITVIHKHVLNRLLSHFICTCHVSHKSLNWGWLLAILIFTFISLHITFKSFIFRIKMSLWLTSNRCSILWKFFSFIPILRMNLRLDFFRKISFSWRSWI